MNRDERDALEDTIRRLSAEVSAQQFLIEVLLANFVGRLSTADAEAFMSDLLRVSQKADHLRTQNEHEAEAAADIAVRSQQRIAEIASRAAQRAGLSP